MAGSEKLARIIDALAVRLASLGVDAKAFDDGGPTLRSAAQRVAAWEKAQLAARSAARGPTMGGSKY
jgi:hypothetical protein